LEFVYSGPSWAARSFDSAETETQHGVTNLAREWGIPHFDASKHATNVLWQKNRILTFPKKLPIIWIYPEPFTSLDHFTSMSITELLTRSDWKDIWRECNDRNLQEINSLGRPVLLIGGHSDVIDCSGYSNIQVGCPSWQKFIAETAGLEINCGVVKGSYDNGTKFSVKHCWGAEIVHRRLWENPDIDADKTLVDSIWDMFFFWKELERNDLFYDVHPNKKATKLFAVFLKSTVAQFLENTK